MPDMGRIFSKELVKRLRRNNSGKCWYRESIRENTRGVTGR